MLVIRMQRTGRKGHAQFRVVVQDSRRTPTSGKIVAAIGSYNPHAKTAILDKEKASFYLEHGAQPSPRVVRLLKSEGVNLPDWVNLADTKTGKLRNPEKLRRNRPAGEAATQAAPEKPVDTIEEEASEEPAVAGDEGEVIASEEPTGSSDEEVASDAEPLADKPTKETVA